MTAPPAYPLTWPFGWPRTARSVQGPYKTALPQAVKNLRKELTLLAGQAAAATLTISSNSTLGVETPKDGGVVAYFTWDGEEFAIPCDRWLRLEQNVQAIALTIDAMRAMERHGAKHMVKSMFRGLAALPAPADWRSALGHPRTLLEAEAVYREKMKKAHPDLGGNQDAATALSQAIEAARKEFGNG